MEYELKGTELRIGNWISYRGEKDLVVVSIQAPWGSVQTERYIGSGIYVGSDDLRDYEPILITEEWLLRFGFEKDKKGYWFSSAIISKGLIFSAIQIRELMSIRITGPFGLVSVKIKYVHQLQNIYHALTNEDLKSDSSPQSFSELP